jgi:membrane protease YdiL (CAAX protease family)
MRKEKLMLGIVLFVLGLAGILSILTMELPLPEEAKEALLEIFTPGQIKWLVLINPTIMLIGAILIGVFLHEKVGLKVPLIEGILKKEEIQPPLSRIVQSGIAGGIIAGVLLTLISLAFYPHLPEAFLEIGKQLQPSLAARFLYGGLTEEILMRFGLMTFVVWLASKLFKETNATAYWIGILFAALLFAIGHFPIVFQAVEHPPGLLLGYILIGNAIGGIIFGWLYWKSGLESAFLAHIVAHVVMVLAEPLLV